MFFPYFALNVPPANQLGEFEMTKNVFFALFLICMGTSAVADEQAPFAAPKPGNFDNYVLSITYHNDYCAQYPKDAECTTQPVMQGMSLHGLWPSQNDDMKNSYGYCDLPASQVKNWCAADIDVKGRMSPEEFADLSSVQPGDISCLYNHEWYAHGACSALSVADYFQDALTLAKRFQQLPRVNELVKNSAGKIVDRAPFQQAIAQDLGPAAANSAIVLCRQDKKTKAWYFSSFSVALDKVNLMQFPAPASFSPMKPYSDSSGKPQPDTGNCPETGIVVAP